MQLTKEVLRINLEDALEYFGDSPAPDGRHGIQHLTFSKQPLGLPASEGYGCFQGGPGLMLGPDNHFKIQAKLGFGTTLNVRLAQDRMYKPFLALIFCT